MGHGPMGPGFQTKFLREWSHISSRYSSCVQGVVVFDCI